ncbi:MAG: NAD-dependent epimerase/dehydratase family protein, partial [Lentisphaeria bacterium]|nr:NAD-dependent epimerase/dehydratase family protein [Lentisphaeria bacterium]
MRILLIGGGGFVGPHLKDFLMQRNHEVFTADLPQIVSAYPEMFSLDLTDAANVESLLKQLHPDRVFLLAAISSVSQSWENPSLAVNVNILGALNVFNAMKKTVPDARLIYIGSGEEYGNSCSEEHPFTEDTNCSPCNPYAVTKFASGKLLELMSVKRNLDYVHLRPFNHFGPGQREGFVIADFCAQITRIESG